MPDQPDDTLPAAPGRERAVLVDRLRGLVIVLMVLDHTRDYFHWQALAFDPTDLTKTTPLLFATRWVTHLCAPTFVFLSGASIRLQQAAGKTGGRLGRFLLARGAWLILLEVTLVSFGFDFAVGFVFLQVIAAIGAGMMAMALVVRLPRWVALALGAVIVAGAWRLARVDPGLGGVAGGLWKLGFVPGLNPFAKGLAVYPLVPWFGVMCLGYAAGDLFRLEARARTRALLAVAGTALVAFALLRVPNLWGDFRPWAPQATPALTVASFLNVSKYPPTLQFVLLTLGVSLPLGLLLERAREHAVARALGTYGETPLFTYLLHIYLVHGAALLLGVARGVPASAFLDFLADPSRLVAAHWGVTLPWVYVAWLAIVAALLPLSRRYAVLKRSKRRWWTSYL